MKQTKLTEETKFLINILFFVDALSRLVGENFQIEAGSALSQSSNKTILIPSYRFEEDGKLMGWRICSQTSGFVSLQVEDTVAVFLHIKKIRFL